MTEARAVKATREQFPDLTIVNPKPELADPQALDWLLSWIENSGKAASE